ncbi:hypothetical protein RhiirA4_469626 [Rhizophagus irregularis]|uniref:Uncharacterized protein n=1 Tax=Rhizophagus irregularis TaxID=588596 RepID=A0A2I1GZZ2_9GLOM|nr:hypothetical protein RhiirA4_469626 [Rhizophagus irregularis]
MEEETLKQYINEYYRGFTGFELEHLEDFAKCLKEYKEFNLAEYEVAHLDKDILFPPGDIKIGVRDARTTSKNNVSKKILMDIAVFTMKMGGENVKRILETIILEKSQKDTTTKDKQGENTTDKEIDRDKIEAYIKPKLVIFYKKFMNFEKQHINDFARAIKENRRVKLEEYEISHLDKDELLPFGKMPPGVRDKEKQMGADVIKDNLMDAAAFTIKMAADIVTKILISSGYDHYEDLQAKDTAVEELKDELNSLIAEQKKDKEKIENLEKEKKIADERIRSLENEVIKLQELEKEKIASKSTTSKIKKGKITEIPVQSTSDDDYLKKHFSERSRDLKFYDFPAYWKDNEIYDSLKQVGYIERLECKWNYKYRTVRDKIRLTTEMEEIFIKGGSNIAIKKKEQYYYFRMFDAKMSATDIKKRYEWQAYKKFNDLPGRPEYEGLKAENLKHGGHFSKIIKVNKIKYILIYFNNENDLLKAIYNSTMEEENMENGLKIKSQDELISGNGTYKKWFGINKFNIPQKPKDGFVDAHTDLISTIPRTIEEHKELDNLNNDFKERLEELDTATATPQPQRKGKKKVTDFSDEDDEEKKNENKKRVVRKQGERENSDTE